MEKKSSCKSLLEYSRIRFLQNDKSGGKLKNYLTATSFCLDASFSTSVLSMLNDT